MRSFRPLPWFLTTVVFLASGACAFMYFDDTRVIVYSRELGGNNFPHAFVGLKGTVDATGEQIDTSLGFTAHSVTPASAQERAGTAA